MSNDIMGQEVKFCEMQLIERIEDFIARFKDVFTNQKMKKIINQLTQKV